MPAWTRALAFRLALLVATPTAIAQETPIELGAIVEGKGGNWTVSQD